MGSMKRWFCLLLLAGALLGLFGQAAAWARMMPDAPTGQAVAAPQMSAECAELMGMASAAQLPADKPCQGMTPDCAAKMGCAVALALFEPFAFNSALQFLAAVPLRAPILPLIGRDTGPEPEPPAFLD